MTNHNKSFRITEESMLEKPHYLGSKIVPSRSDGVPLPGVTPLIFSSRKMITIGDKYLKDPNTLTFEIYLQSG